MKHAPEPVRDDGPARSRSAPAGAKPRRPAGAAQQLLALQRAAGNRATAGLVQGGLRPSTFAAGLAELDAGAQRVVQEAATAATTVATGAGMPDAPPAQPLAEPPDPQLSRPAAPALAAPAAGSGDAPIPASATATSLGQHGAQVDQTVVIAARQADAAAVGMAVPAIAPTVAPARERGPVPEPPPALQTPAGPFPSLRPDVARVLDTGFGGWLSRQSATAQAKTTQAVARHGQQINAASRDHESAVEAAEATAATEIAGVRTGATIEVESQRSSWRAENASITSTARADIASERGAAMADVRQEADRANSAAHQTVTDAYRRAQTEQPGPAVQGSWWSRVKGAVRAVGRGISAGWDTLSSGAKSVVNAAISAASNLVNRAWRAIADRFERFAAAVRAVINRVGDALASVARRVGAAIRAAVRAAVAALDRIVTSLWELSKRMLAALGEALARAGRWIVHRIRDIVDRLVAAGRWVLNLAATVGKLLFVAGSKLLKGLVRAVEDPAEFLAPFTDTVGGWISAAPAKAGEYFRNYLGSPGGGAPVAAGAVVQRQAAPVVQRQADPQATAVETATDTAVAEPGKGDIAWEYISARLAYIGANWPSVVGNVLLEIFVPGVTIYRQAPTMFRAVGRALADLFAGRFSDAVDEALAAARALSAILGTLFAQASIVAFILGSIVGTPVVGAGAMVAIGLTLLGIDAGIQMASILKSWSNLDRAGRTDAELDNDYTVIADSVVSLGVTAALLVIAAVGQKLGKALLTRFPRVTTVLESIRAKIRERIGVSTRRPTSPRLDVKKAPPTAPEATGFPGRNGGPNPLTAVEQRAFDRFIFDKRADGTLTPEFEARLKAATPDQLRAMARRHMTEQPTVEIDQAKRDRATATNASDPLNPRMANTRSEGGNVTSLWNEVPPSAGEIAQAKQIAARTGEPVTLFGDGYPGVDGVIGRPGRPLQLKDIPVDKPVSDVHTSAVTARDKAARFGYHEVEVHINAPGKTVTQVRAEFARQGTAGGVYVDGSAVRRLVVLCSDGVFSPTTMVVTPAVRPQTGDDRDSADQPEPASLR